MPSPRTKPTCVRVLNKYKDYIPHGAIYVGRSSQWGNPYIVGVDGDRKQCIEQYEAHIRGNPATMALIPTLKGKYLVCFCAPLPCHADVLFSLANAT